jgi:hypothetical protein
VLSGLTALDVTAEISGALSSPALSVRSSLDEALATRLRAVAGEQFAKAEAQARAAVDKAVAAKVDPVLKDANGVSSSIAQQLGLSKTQLDQLEQALNAQLLRLGPGGVLKLP